MISTTTVARRRSYAATCIGLSVLLADSCVQFEDRDFSCPPGMDWCEVCRRDASCLREVTRSAIQVNAAGARDGQRNEERQSVVPGTMSTVSTPSSSLSNQTTNAASTDPTPALDATLPSDSGAPDAGPKNLDELPAEPCLAYGENPRELCLGNNGGCLSLRPAVSEALSLWLDVSTLREQETESGIWCDRSGRGNHAHNSLGPIALAVETDADRQVDETLSASYRMQGGWLMLNSSLGNSSFVFDEEDFSILIAAAVPLLDTDNQTVELFSADADLNWGVSFGVYSPTYGGGIAGNIYSEAAMAEVSLESRGAMVFDQRFRLYTLRRRGSSFQIRVNGSANPWGNSRNDIPANFNLGPYSSDVELLAGIGANDLYDSASLGRARVAAVVVLKGIVSEAELAEIEGYLCIQLDICAPVNSDIGSPVTPAPLE